MNDGFDDQAKWHPGQVEFLLTVDSCFKDATGPLGPAQARRCSASLRSASALPILEVAPRVTAVLFEEGSTEGDQAALDRQTAERGARLRIRQYWLDRFRESCARCDAPDQIKRFAEMVRAPEANLPAELLGDTNFQRESDGWNNRYPTPCSRRRCTTWTRGRRCAD